MADLNELWSEYFLELDPVRRGELLDRLIDAGADTTAFCHRLYQERYRDKKDPDKQVDNWLWKLVYLPGLYRRRRGLSKPIRHEMEGALRELHLDEWERLNEDERHVLTMEFRNAARRYLSTCRSARYGSRLLGLKKANEEQKLDRAALEIWSAARGLPEKAGLGMEFRPWSEALLAELTIFDPACEQRYRELEQTQHTR